MRLQQIFFPCYVAHISLRKQWMYSYSTLILYVCIPIPSSHHKSWSKARSGVLYLGSAYSHIQVLPSWCSRSSTVLKSIYVNFILDLGPSFHLLLCLLIVRTWQKNSKKTKREEQIEGLVDFPMKLPKLPQKLALNIACYFIWTKSVKSQSEMTDGTFVLVGATYFNNSAWKRCKKQTKFNLV